MNRKLIGWGCLFSCMFIVMAFTYFAGGWAAMLTVLAIFAFFALLITGAVFLILY